MSLESILQENYIEGIKNVQAITYSFTVGSLKRTLLPILNKCYAKPMPTIRPISKGIFKKNQSLYDKMYQEIQLSKKNFDSAFSKADKCFQSYCKKESNRNYEEIKLVFDTVKKLNSIKNEINKTLDGLKIYYNKELTYGLSDFYWEFYHYMNKAGSNSKILTTDDIDQMEEILKKYQIVLGNTDYNYLLDAIRWILPHYWNFAAEYVSPEEYIQRKEFVDNQGRFVPRHPSAYFGPFLISCEDNGAIRKIAGSVATCLKCMEILRDKYITTEVASGGLENLKNYKKEINKYCDHKKALELAHKIKKGEIKLKK